MKYVSVGPGGIFASQAKDESVWCRFNMTGGKATTKVAMNEKGDGWSKIANVRQNRHYLKFVAILN